MRKKVIIKNQEVSYELKRSRRARRMRLSVSCEGNLSAVLPWLASERRLEKFIKEKADWIFNKIDYFKKHPSSGFALGGGRREYQKNKQAAASLARERVKFFNRYYGFRYGRISIKNQRTRWGSCSQKGNLNFNYKIALAPREFVDYLVAHELCHLKEPNHSEKFWVLVGQTIPDYKKIRKMARG